MDRRLFLSSAASTLAFGGVSSLWAGAYNEAIAPLISRAALEPNMTVFAVDMKTGAVLADIDADRPMPLASVTKAFVAAYALETLGREFRFETRVLGPKRLEAGLYRGAWTVAGSGDPTFNVDNLAQMIGAMAQSGVTAQKGGLAITGGDFPQIDEIDPTQPDFVSYNPVVSGANLNFNRVLMRWEAGGGTGPSFFAQGRAASVPVGNVKAQLSDRNGPVYIYEGRRNGAEIWDVQRAALSKAGSRNLPVRHMEEYWRQTLAGLAQQNQIKIDTNTAQNRQISHELAQHKSQPLEEIVRDMLKYSTNLTAESLALRAAHAQGMRPRSLDDSGFAIQKWLVRRYGVRNVSLLNGSGLNENSASTARELVRFFSQTDVMSTLSPLLKQIEIDRRHGEASSGKIAIFAKTGTLNFVTALSGYVMKQPDHPIAFAILCADMKRRRAIPENMRHRPDGGRSWLTRARATQWNILRRLVA